MNNNNYNARIILASVISTFLMVVWIRYYGKKTLPQNFNTAVNKAEQEYVENKQEQNLVEKQLLIEEKNINTDKNIDNQDIAYVNIDTEKLSGNINLRGLIFDNLILKDYNKAINTTDKVQLLSKPNDENSYYLKLGWKSSNSIKLPNENTLWKSNKTTLSVNNPVILTYDNNDGIIFQIMISVDENYMFTFKQYVINNTKDTISFNINNEISKKIGKDKDKTVSVYEGFIGSFSGNIEEIQYNKLAKKPYSFNKGFSWAGFTDKYWLVSLATERTESNLINVSTNFLEGNYTINFESTDIVVVPNTKEGISNFVFTGPKILKLLDQYSFQYDLILFDRAVDFGWFYFLTKPIYIVLKGFYGILGNFGLAILLLTLIVKFAMYPFTKKSFVSMGKMKLLQPKIENLRARYANDKMKLNMETMKLYKKENVSPLSGCLPMLVQIPVFFSLYKVLAISIDMRQAPFFGYIKDLSASDPTTIWNLFGLLPFQVNFLHIGFLPCLMAFTMWIQQKLSSQQTSVNSEAQSAAKLMPIIFLIMFAGMPTGLLIYWTFSNIISIAQQYWVEKKILKIEK